jgi:ABC-2 type transport system permease protein
MREIAVLWRSDLARAFRRLEYSVPPLFASLLGLVTFVRGFPAVGAGAYLAVLLPGWTSLAVTTAAATASILATVDLSTKNVRYLRSLPLSPAAILSSRIVSGSAVAATVSVINLTVANALWLHLQPPQFLLAAGTLMLGAATVVCFLMSIMMWLRDLSKLSIMSSFVLSGLQYVGGVYFPPSAFPALIRPLAYVNPLTDTAQTIRDLAAGVFHPVGLARLGALLLIWFGVALWSFRRRLMSD